MTVSGPAFLTIEWALVVITFILCGIRFRLRYRNGKGWNIPDILVGLGWIFYVAQGVMDTIEYQKGLFDGRIAPDPARSPDQYGPEYGLATLEDTVLILKLLWVQTCIYYVTMYCVKFAMLGFYYELIPLSLPRLRMAIHLALGLSVVGLASTVLLKLFYCEPISTNWAVDHTHCKNLDSPVTDIYRWSFHVVTDLIIYIIPMFLLRLLDLPMSQKIGVALTFAAGFVCIIFAIIVQATFIITHSPTIISFTWATGEMSWSLLVVCLPAFKSFLTKDMWYGFSKLRRIGSGEKESSDDSSGTRDRAAVKELSLERDRLVIAEKNSKGRPARNSADESDTNSTLAPLPESRSAASNADITRRIADNAELPV